MAGAVSQAGDADSSWAPVLTSDLQGSVNVHRGALLLVPQWRCIGFFCILHFIFGWQLTTEIVITDRNCSNLFLFNFRLPNYNGNGVYQPKFWSLTSKVSQLSSFWKILINRNWNKLFHYNFGYNNFGWQLTIEIVITDRNCNNLGFFHNNTICLCVYITRKENMVHYIFICTYMGIFGGCG